MASFRIAASWTNSLLFVGFPSGECISALVRVLASWREIFFAQIDTSRKGAKTRKVGSLLRAGESVLKG